jgi:hypothetical protein
MPLTPILDERHPPCLARGACPRLGYRSKPLGNRPVSLYPNPRGLDSPAMPDDGGVLGNLPRSRPGRRSAKRARPEEGAGPKDRAADRSARAAGRPAKTSAKAASRAERSGAKAAAGPSQARPRSTARAKPAAAGRRAAGAAAGEERPAPQRGGDPVTDVIRGVAGLAGTGAKVAGGVARELLRRVPRP